MFLLDYIRQRWQPRGSVVTAGVPPEARPSAIALPEGLIAAHLSACDELPHDSATKHALEVALSDPAAIQFGARAIAQKLIETQAVNADIEALVSLVGVLLAEIARAMYISAARQRDGAIGIRLLPDPSCDAAAMRLIEQDAHGLGAGVYPFDAVPANPTPGKRCGFYIRVVTAS